MRGLALALLSACGRLDFAPRGDAATADGTATHPCAMPGGHDEDGDGVDDNCDGCPHLADPDQIDTDGDGIDDACDPEPMNPRQQVALFATMRAGDQPFQTNGTGTWTQLADALHFDGNQDGQLAVHLPMFGNVQFALGFAVQQVIGAQRHQLSIGADPSATLPHELVELNEDTTFSLVSVSNFDGTAYHSDASMTLPNGIHTGALTLRGTELVGTSVRIDAGWPGEPYSAEAPTTIYQGSNRLGFNAQNLAFDLTYVFVVTW